MKIAIADTGYAGMPHAILLTNRIPVDPGDVAAKGCITDLFVQE